MCFDFTRNEINLIARYLYKQVIGLFVWKKTNKQHLFSDDL